MFAKGLVWFAGLIFVIYGTAFAFWPTKMTGLVSGDAPDTPSGVIDLRATYGGMSITVRAAILILGMRSATMGLALLITAILLLGMAVTRQLGILLDGDANAAMQIYLIAEVVGAMLALYVRQLWRRLE